MAWGFQTIPFVTFVSRSLNKASVSSVFLDLLVQGTRMVINSMKSEGVRFVRWVKKEGKS